MAKSQDKIFSNDKCLISQEIKAYQSFVWSSSDNEMIKKHGPLLFYKENHKRFPLLSTMAKAIFCMLPASLASERLFRGTGRIITTDRNLLAPENLEHLTQIKNNRINKQEKNL